MNNSTITRTQVELRAYYLWLHSNQSQPASYYWLQAEHGLYPLGQCQECKTQGRHSHPKTIK